MVEVTLNTPLAEALNSVIQPKLLEVGWSSGGVDVSALSEYIILMLVNGKTQSEIATELSGDLLQLGPDDPGAMQFSEWLSNQVETLHRQLSEAQAPTAPIVQSSALTKESQPDPLALEVVASQPEAMQDMNMDQGGAETMEGNVPTGPRLMRGSRDKRLLGHLSRAMDRSGEDNLHRIRGDRSAGRVNSHSREPPKGPRNGAGRGGRMSSIRGGDTMHHNGMPNYGPSAGLAHMTPQQQRQLYAMYEEQARMMSQILSPQQQQQMFRPANMNGSMGYNGMPGIPHQALQSGRSLFDRVDSKPQQHAESAANTPFNARAAKFQSRQTGPTQDSSAMDTTSSMDVESSQQTAERNIADIVCRFNLACSKADCQFAHQSPAAPPGTTIDVKDPCPFGAACTNRKCVARHPSPATKTSHQAEQDCKYFPNCTNPACTFKHPTSPLCRNGADCTWPGCTFTHVQKACKFNPCLNQECPFKHVEGQKRGKFDDKVWSAAGDKKGHVSERKFVDESAAMGEEELIVPGLTASSSSGQDELIT